MRPWQPLRAGEGIRNFSNQPERSQTDVKSVSSEAAGVHICAQCASLKPTVKRRSQGVSPVKGFQDLSVSGWALELCCGTGASLAFMHSLVCVSLSSLCNPSSCLLCSCCSRKPCIPPTPSSFLSRGPVAHQISVYLTACYVSVIPHFQTFIPLFKLCPSLSVPLRAPPSLPQRFCFLSSCLFSFLVHTPSGLPLQYQPC